MKNTTYTSVFWRTTYVGWQAKLDSTVWYTCSLAMCLLAIALPFDVVRGNGTSFIINYTLFAWYLHALLQMNTRQIQNDYIKTSYKLGLLEEYK